MAHARTACPVEYTGRRDGSSLLCTQQASTASNSSVLVQVTEACKQLARCIAATPACIGIAVAEPGALPALLRLVRCCNRSKPHTSLLAEALAALGPLARNAQGAAPGLAVTPCLLYMFSDGVTDSHSQCGGPANASGPLMKSAQPAALVTTYVAFNRTPLTLCLPDNVLNG